MSTLTEEELSRERVSTLSRHLCTFYHSTRIKHHFVMITPWFCAVQVKKAAKVLLPATSFPSIPWSSSSTYSLCFFLQGLSHPEATALLERPVLLEKGPSSSLHSTIFFLAGRKWNFCTFTFSHQLLSYDTFVRNMFSSEISFWFELIWQIRV